MRLNEINTEKLIYIDIETVPIKKKFEELNAREKEIFVSRVDNDAKNTLSYEDYYYNKNVSFMPEFARVACVSLGWFTNDENNLKFKLTSYAGEDEISILKGISLIGNRILSGHNIIIFDIPFLIKRYFINSIEIPASLNIIGKKPWEINHVDTIDIWKVGQWKGSISLDDLCFFLGVASPKAVMNGGLVASMFFEKQIASIVRYCEGDVVSSANVLRRLKQETIIDEGNIIYSNCFTDAKIPKSKNKNK